MSFVQQNTMSLSSLSLFLLSSLSLSLLFSLSSVSPIPIPDHLPPHLESSVVTFVTSSNGYSELSIAKGEGEGEETEARVITRLRGQITHPRLSHTREEIVFSSDYGREHPILFVIGSDGKNMRPLTVDEVFFFSSLRRLMREREYFS